MSGPEGDLVDFPYFRLPNGLFFLEKGVNINMSPFELLFFCTFVERKKVNKALSTFQDTFFS